jgi:hypothetical protein
LSPGPQTSTPERSRVPRISEAITRAPLPPSLRALHRIVVASRVLQAHPRRANAPEPRRPPPHHCRVSKPPRPSPERCCAPSLEVLHEAQPLPKISEIITDVSPCPVPRNPTTKAPSRPEFPRPPLEPCHGPSPEVLHQSTEAPRDLQAHHRHAVASRASTSSRSTGSSPNRRRPPSCKTHRSAIASGTPQPSPERSPPLSLRVLYRSASASRDIRGHQRTADSPRPFKQRCVPRLPRPLRGAVAPSTVLHKSAVALEAPSHPQPSFTRALSPWKRVAHEASPCSDTSEVNPGTPSSLALKARHEASRPSPEHQHAPSRKFLRGASSRLGPRRPRRPKPLSSPPEHSRSPTSPRPSPHPASRPRAVPQRLYRCGVAIRAALCCASSCSPRRPSLGAPRLGEPSERMDVNLSRQWHRGLTSRCKPLFTTFSLAPDPLGLNSSALAPRNSTAFTKPP